MFDSSVYVSRVATGMAARRGKPNGSPASSTAMPSGRDDTRSSKSRLGREVALAAAVQFQVLGGDPGEHGGAELHVIGATHLEPV